MPKEDLSSRTALFRTTMSFISASPGRISQRIRGDLLRSSLSTMIHMDTGNHTMHITESTKTKRMNLFTAINDALSTALKTDPNSIIFGQGEYVSSI